MWAMVGWFCVYNQYLQALLQRTINDYKSAGHDPKSSSLEIRLIQSQNDIRNPEIKFRAERYT